MAGPFLALRRDTVTVSILSKGFIENLSASGADSEGTQTSATSPMTSAQGDHQCSLSLFRRLHGWAPLCALWAWLHFRLRRDRQRKAPTDGSSAQLQADGITCRARARHHDAHVARDASTRVTSPAVIAVAAMTVFERQGRQDVPAVDAASAYCPRTHL